MVMTKHFTAVQFYGRISQMKTREKGLNIDVTRGQYNSGAEFAQMIAEDCGDIGRNMAGWIEIDWEASWNNLSYDYV